MSDSDGRQADSRVGSRLGERHFRTFLRLLVVFMPFECRRICSTPLRFAPSATVTSVATPPQRLRSRGVRFWGKKRPASRIIAQSLLVVRDCSEIHEPVGQRIHQRYLHGRRGIPLWANCSYVSGVRQP
jgi:hypothetical protein